MTKLRCNAAVAAVALGFALTAPVASAEPINLVINGDFGLPGVVSIPSDWTRNLYIGPSNSNSSYFINEHRSTSVEQALGIYNMGNLACARNCPSTESQSIAQLISDLIPNENYQLTFYAAAYSYVTDKNLKSTSIAPASLHVSLGGQDSGPITLPFWDNFSTSQPQWAKKTINFIHAENSTSALLKFVQSFTGTDPSCIPCADILYITNVSLTDQGPGPGPSVPEPGTLGILALSLGALGLLHRRRRNNTAA